MITLEPETVAYLEPRVMEHDRAMLVAYRAAKQENIKATGARTWAGDPAFEPEVQWNVEAADSIRELIPEEDDNG